MALGELTKQLAEQALRTAAAPSTPTPAPAPQAENPAATMLGQVQAMQRALKEDEELAVLFDAGPETLRVQEMFAPSPQVVVLAGVDAQRNITRAVAHVESLRLVCKVLRVQPGARPLRVAFAPPRGRAE
jgi:hypothetical protein